MKPSAAKPRPWCLWITIVSLSLILISAVALIIVGIVLQDNPSNAKRPMTTQEQHKPEYQSESQLDLASQAVQEDVEALVPESPVETPEEMVRLVPSPQDADYKFNFWDPNNKPKPEELFAVTDKYCEGKCDGASDCRPLYLNRTILWEKENKTFAIVPRGGPYEHSDTYIWQDQVKPMRTTTQTWFMRYNPNGPSKASREPCHPAGSSYQLNPFGWGIPQLEIFISWGKRVRSEDEIREYIIQDWERAVNTSFARTQLSGRENRILPPIFCDWKVGPHNADCNIIIYDSYLKSQPHRPHVQLVVSPEGRRHEPIGAAQKPSFHEIVTNTSLGEFTLDSMVSVLYGEQTNAFYRRINPLQLKAVDATCHAAVKGRKISNWADPRLECLRDFANDNGIGEVFAAKSHWTRKKADQGVLCTCNASSNCADQADFTCDQ